MGENVYNYKIVTDHNMTTSVTSSVADLSRVDGFSIIATISGSPVGTFEVQVGNTEDDFTTDPDSVIQVSGVTRIAYEKPTNTFDKVRCKYTATSGTGTLNVQINGKGDAR